MPGLDLINPSRMLYDFYYGRTSRIGANTRNMDNQTRYYTAQFGIPFASDILRSEENTRYWNDYLKNRNLTWADVKYPTRLANGNMLSSMMTSAYQTGFGANALQALYDIDKPIPKMDKWNPMFG